MKIVNSVKLTASPSETGWSQVHDYNPSDVDAVTRRGRLVVCISIKQTDKGVYDGVAAINLGREIVGRLQNEYYKDSTITAFNALKNALEVINSEFPNLSLDVAAGSFVRNVFYAAASGGAQVKIFRKGSLATVLSSKNEVVIASGHPKPGDRIIFATSSFTRIVAEGALKAALSKQSLEDAVDSMATLVHSQEDDGTIASVFLEFDEDYEEYEKPEAEPETDRKEQSFEETTVKFIPKQSFINRFRSRIKNTLPDKSLYVKRETTEEAEARRKKTISLGLIVLVLLVVSIFFGIRQKTKSDKDELFEEKLTQAEHLLGEAEKIASLNPARARELFSESRKLVDELEQRNIEDEKLTLLITQIEERETNVLGEKSFNPELYVDLSLLAEGFIGEEVSVSGKVINVFDGESDRVVEIIVPSKRARVVAGPSLVEGVEAITSYAKNLYLVKNDGIYLAEGEKQVIETSIGGSTLTATFAGNIYTLNPDDSTITRFSGSEDSYSSGSNWFAPGINVDVGNAIDWAIDGMVWVLGRDGEVQKFSNGLPQMFSLASTYPEFESPIKIYSSEETEFIYILDSGVGRVFVFDKEGGYKKQYVADSIKNARDLAIFEDEGIGIILTGGKLESFSLN